MNGLINILNSRNEISKIDPQNVLGSIESLPDQCLDAWEKANQISILPEYQKVKNIVACGMGGSGLGARVIESLFSDQLSIPFVRINDYNLPNFVNEDSLIILSSYSGTTEETVSNANQAISRHAKCIVIATGNTLIDIAHQNNLPYYQIEPRFNPSHQPRMAIGYSIVGQLALLNKIGLIKLSLQEINQSVQIMKKIIQENTVEIPQEQNLAKQLAQQMKGKIIFYVSSEHLIGAAHVVNNQQNENAKNISMDVAIPELNHHLMEGLKHPEINISNLEFIFFCSSLYSTRIQQRFEITKDVVGKQNIQASAVALSAPTKLSQVFELIQLGGYANFYLSLLYGQNPAPIPWVDYFKTQLGQPLGK